MLVWVRKRLPIWCGCAAVDLNCHCDLSNVKLWHKFKWSCLIHLVYEQLCSKSVTCHVATSFVIRSIHLQVSLARSSKARLFVRPYFRERKKKKCWISKHSKDDNTWKLPHSDVLQSLAAALSCQGHACRMSSWIESSSASRFQESCVWTLYHC